MFVDLRKSPEVLSLIKKAGAAYYHTVEAEILPFEHPMRLDSNWDGGTRYFHSVVSLVDDRVMTVQENGTPWTPATPVLEALPPGFALVSTCVFRGKNMAARIYMHASNLNHFMLPESPALTEKQKTVLEIHCGLKSAYRKEEARRQGIDEAEYMLIQSSLIALGLLSKNKAVTVAGMNARGKRF